jgi:hypothetical protein
MIGIQEAMRGMHDCAGMLKLKSRPKNAEHININSKINNQSIEKLLILTKYNQYKYVKYIHREFQAKDNVEQMKYLVMKAEMKNYSRNMKPIGQQIVSTKMKAMSIISKIALET